MTGPHLTRRVFLIGFMGAGKTSAGKMLARRLNWKFFDLDELIEQREQASIAAIFSRAGESGFRQIESAVLGNYWRRNSRIPLLPWEAEHSFNHTTATCWRRQVQSQFCWMRRWKNWRGVVRRKRAGVLWHRTGKSSMNYLPAAAKLMTWPGSAYRPPGSLWRAW